MPTSTRQNAPVYTVIPGKFVTSQWAGRVVGPYKKIDTPHSVGADDSVRPQDALVLQ